ncbi:TldD/PmbA family protein [Candidatus Phytoplasma pini]|uniref:Zn-dependent protease n=1 Tax=Candidatus Phytoplasma pini TaxID=267362 RepID=A0A559KJS5_9MOLU|nr:TldD/PmbA family protein [Candidatus Phytoplasma pini]TVY12383.1 Zn-dependent protease [Candidatus Phytoplasma pini]
MLSKFEIQDILEQSLFEGADFAELFFEDSIMHFLKVVDQELFEIDIKHIFGLGIRLLKDTEEIYIYTNKMNYHDILNLIKTNNFKRLKTHSAIPLGQAKIFNNNIKKPFNSLNLLDKAKKMLHLSQIMKNHDNKIFKTSVNLEQNEQKVLIANSQGLYQNDFRPYIKCSLLSFAKDGDNIQNFSDSVGLSLGLEIFDIVDFETLATKVAQKAVILLSAEELKPQIMPVIINNGVGGVIFHEACGHSLEATAIARDLSPFCGKINQKIASEIVTAYDDGTIEGYWGKLNFDDEGHKTQKNLLIEKGILKNYLVDFRNSRKMNMPSTGSSRRQSYKYSPTSRMNSTYIDAGKDNPEKIIKETKYGLYAEYLGGGTVVPTTGEFNFMVKLGYLIENGVLTKPIKGMMLIGDGQSVLLKIDRVANNLAFSQGYCGSVSGYVPVDLGQPTIRVSEMIIGGSKK